MGRGNSGSSNVTAWITYRAVDRVETVGRRDQPPLGQRILLAVLALVFALQSVATAQGDCSLRAKFVGGPCCCQADPVRDHAERESSCCSRPKQGHEPTSPAPRKQCRCEVSAPPLVPVGGEFELQHRLFETIPQCEHPTVPYPEAKPALIVIRTQGPPGFRTCFHACLGKGLSRALAFERTLRS